MKTQINDIVRGNQHVAGTSYAIRYERAEKVFAENGNTLEITYKGVPLTLSRFTSCSGKTQWYEASLTYAQVHALFPDDTKHNQSPELVDHLFIIHNDCTATITRFRRKSLFANWKTGYEHRLDNEDIVIL